MEQILTTLCDSICLILEAISRFDLSQVDPNRLAEIGQVYADMGRIVYTFINVLVVIFGGAQ